MKFKHDKNNYMYWSSYSNNGKSCVIAFYECENNVFEVAFGVGKNRKQVLSWLTCNGNFIQDKISGNGSIEYLVFAYKAIQEFEKFIKVQYPNRNFRIEIYADDERRFNVYKYYLHKIGYKECELNSNCWTKINFIYKEF